MLQTTPHHTTPHHTTLPSPHQGHTSHLYIPHRGEQSKNYCQLWSSGVCTGCACTWYSSVYYPCGIYGIYKATVDVTITVSITVSVTVSITVALTRTRHRGPGAAAGSLAPASPEIPLALSLAPYRDRWARQGTHRLLPNPPANRLPCGAGADIHQDGQSICRKVQQTINNTNRQRDPGSGRHAHALGSLSERNCCCCNGSVGLKRRTICI